MTANNALFTSWVALTTEIAGLLELILIILFFTIGQPSGALNEVFFGITGILSVILVKHMACSDQSINPQK
jgi:hypothetical protein